MADTAVAPVKSFSPVISDLCEKLVNLSVKDAQQVVDCLKSVHGIEPAGGAVMMAGPAAVAEAAPVKDTFDVVLNAAGDKKIQVIKVVRAATGLGLKEAKDLVDSAPKPVKQAMPKADAEALKRELEEAGAAVEMK